MSERVLEIRFPAQAKELKTVREAGGHVPTDG